MLFSEFLMHKHAHATHTYTGQGMVAHACYPNILKAEAGESLKCEGSLVYTARSRTAGLHRETLGPKQSKNTMEVWSIFELF